MILPRKTCKERRAWLFSALILIACMLMTSCGKKESEEPRIVIPSLSVGEAEQKLELLDQSFPDEPKDAALRNEWENAQMYFRKARFLMGNYTVSKEMLEYVSKELWNIERSLQIVKSGGPVPLIPGKRDEGYYSENDRSFQPFYRYVPKSAKNGKKLPLIIYLHGYSPFLNIINWNYFPESLVKFAEEENVCLVAPFGRSNTDFQGIGEQDVLNAVAEMKERYPIDEDRIILSGLSMGGMGVWTIGAHYPDRFAGLLVIAGRGDYYFWHEKDRASLVPYKRSLVDAEFGHSLLPNLKNIPIFALHGGMDGAIPVAEARHMMRAVKKVNADARYVELADGGHVISDPVFEREDVRKWILGLRRTVRTEFEYRTYHPRYNTCEWVIGDDYIRSEFPAEIAARVENGKVIVKAKGVGSVYILKNRLPAAIKDLPVVKEGDFKLDYLEDEKSPWLRSLPRGPVKEVFLAPFIFVSGARVGDGPALGKFRSVVLDWQNFAKAYPRAVHESDMTPANLAQYNVWIVGEPEDSRLVRQVLESSPIEITSTEYIIGDKKFQRTGNGLCFVYQNPWNPGKLVVVQCGIAWGKGLSENHKYDFLPDYIVYAPDSDWDGSNRALCAGFFNEKWQVVPELMDLPGQKQGH